MTLQDKFGGMALNEPIKIELDDETIELDVKVDDIVPLMSMGGEDGMSEEQVDKLTDTFETILYRTYLPYWDDVRDQEPDNLSDKRQEENDEMKQYINGLLVRKLPVMLTEMVKELGWADESDIQGADFPADTSQHR